MAQTRTRTRPELLVVDDESELREVLGEYLSRHGYSVRSAADAGEARRLIEADPPDIALLDVNMPGESGLTLARWLRTAHRGIGVMMITTLGDSVDRIVGLELGADDYVSKPFELREVLARVRAVLRRTAEAECAPAATPGSTAAATARGAGPEPLLHGCVPFGLCSLDLDRRRLLATDGETIETTAAEFDLLVLFARHPNQPLSRDRIMEQAHNRGWDAIDRSIDLRMMRLRRKIERNPEKPEVLKTVRNVGYVFVPMPPIASA